ncbi:uncharacterized protein LOC108022674 [Drosophila biarmipes]|uniref:uncharacterized protein LOC108022674 n=1 Tax=Drosophila biarmipes TaxID=125945 RepID=UPI0007E894DA|nr:uncharacterized protein LOC108022674 [Drosophila biarmipes]
MVIVQGMFEISELAAGSIGCVGLFMAGCNALPMQHVPDLPAALFVLSTVCLLHHLRVMNWPPLQELWRLLLELLAFYLGTQIVVVLVWQQFHNLIDILRDTALNTRLALSLLESYPTVYIFMRQDVCYFVKLIVSLACTYKAVKVTHALDYFLPARRIYRYYADQAEVGIFAEAGRISRQLPVSKGSSRRPQSK